MTAGDKMQVRIDRHRQLQRERQLSEQAYSGPWAPRELKRDGNDVAKQIRADVIKRQNSNSAAGGDDDDENSSSLSKDGGVTSSLATIDSVTSLFSFSLSRTSTLGVTSSSSLSSHSSRSTSQSSTSSLSLSTSSSSTTSQQSTFSTTRTTKSVSTSSRQTSSSSLSQASVTLATSTDSLTTSVQVVTQSASQATAVAAATTTSSSSGPGAGLIIGIVAAALAGVVIIAAVVGFLFKKANHKADPFDADPFDKDEFRRQSAAIPEGFGSDDGHPSMIEHHDYGHSGYGAEDDGYAGNTLTAGAAGMAGGAYGASSMCSLSENGAPRPPSMLARHADAYRDYQVQDTMQPMPQYNAAFAVPPQFPPMAHGGEDPYSLAGVAGGMQKVQNIDNPYAHLDRNPSASQLHATEATHYYATGGAGSADQATRLQRNGSGGTSAGSDSSNDQHDHQETSGRPLSSEEGRSGTPDIPNVQQTYALGSEEGHQSDPSGRQSAMDNLDYPPLSNPYDQQFYHQEQQQATPTTSSPPAALQVRNLTGGRERRGDVSDPSQKWDGNRHSGGSQISDDVYGGVY